MDQRNNLLKAVVVRAVLLMVAEASKDVLITISKEATLLMPA
jgi:hypothetical protein